MKTNFSGAKGVADKVETVIVIVFSVNLLSLDLYTWVVRLRIFWSWCEFSMNGLCLGIFLSVLVNCKNGNVAVFGKRNWIKSCIVWDATFSDINGSIYQNFSK